MKWKHSERQSDKKRDIFVCSLKKGIALKHVISLIPDSCPRGRKMEQSNRPVSQSVCTRSVPPVSVYLPIHQRLASDRSYLYSGMTPFVSQSFLPTWHLVSIFLIFPSSGLCYLSAEISHSYNSSPAVPSVSGEAIPRVTAAFPSTQGKIRLKERQLTTKKKRWNKNKPTLSWCMVPGSFKNLSINGNGPPLVPSIGRTKQLPGAGPLTQSSADWYWKYYRLALICSQSGLWFTALWIWWACKLSQQNLLLRSEDTSQSLSGRPSFVVVLHLFSSTVHRNSAWFPGYLLESWMSLMLSQYAF